MLNIASGTYFFLKRSMRATDSFANTAVEALGSHSAASLIPSNSTEVFCAGKGYTQASRQRPALDRRDDVSSSFIHRQKSPQTPAKSRYFKKVIRDR